LFRRRSLVPLPPISPTCADTPTTRVWCGTLSPMFIGHFGVALAAKRWAPRTSLGTLFFAAEFLDLIWPVFLPATSSPTSRSLVPCSTVAPPSGALRSAAMRRASTLCINSFFTDNEQLLPNPVEELPSTRQVTGRTVNADAARCFRDLSETSDRLTEGALGNTSASRIEAGLKLEKA
jgi:hypothetical protein